MVAPIVTASLAVLAAFSAYRYFFGNPRKKEADRADGDGRPTQDQTNASNERGEKSTTRNYVELLVEALRQDDELSSVRSDELCIDDYARLYRLCARFRSEEY